MGREVASFRRIRTLFITTTNVHDLERTVLLAPLLDQVNGAGKSSEVAASCSSASSRSRVRRSSCSCRSAVDTCAVGALRALGLFAL
jgi:hypothetical protein